MESITRTMKLNRVTKGAARFGEISGEGEPEVIGNIYLKKWSLGADLAGLPIGDVEDSDVTISVTVGPASD